MSGIQINHNRTQLSMCQCLTYVKGKMMTERFTHINTVISQNKEKDCSTNENVISSSFIIQNIKLWSCDNVSEQIICHHHSIKIIRNFAINSKSDIERFKLKNFNITHRILFGSE